MLVALILLIVGFFFPPAWLGLVGYVIYLFSTGSTRRAKEIERRVASMVAARRDYAVFPELYFAAAWRYAKERGAAGGSMPNEDDDISTTMTVDGRSYSVIFMKERDGGTAISVEDWQVAQRRIERDLEERLARDPRTGISPAEFVQKVDGKNFDEVTEMPSWAGDRASAKEFADYFAHELAGAGVAKAYWNLLFKDEEPLRVLLGVVGAAESEGFDFDFQKRVSVIFIENSWRELSEEHKQLARKVSLNPEEFDVDMDTDLVASIVQLAAASKSSGSDQDEDLGADDYEDWDYVGDDEEDEEPPGPREEAASYFDELMGRENLPGPQTLRDALQLELDALGKPYEVGMEGADTGRLAVLAGVTEDFELWMKLVRYLMSQDDAHRTNQMMSGISRKDLGPPASERRSAPWVLRDAHREGIPPQTWDRIERVLKKFENDFLSGHRKPPLERLDE